jgi:hypothetical protein
MVCLVKVIRVFKVFKVIGEMESWQNGKWINWHDKLTKQQVDETASWQNSKLAKTQVD